jgi:hypothetical protein
MTSDDLRALIREVIREVLRDQPPSAPAGAPAPGTRRVERGAVTERMVREAAAAGERRLVLGRRAVLTPLARDRARAIGVEIVKEQ